MDDLIYRQAAIDEIKDMYIAAEKWAYEAKDEETKARAESCMATNIEMKLRIEKLPSAQSEQKKGKWIHYDEGDFDYDYKCSNCGYAVWDDSDFCPNCGCEMER